MGLPFDLLSDWDREVSEKYGAFNKREKVSNRRSFLIDKEGVVRFIQESGLNEAREHEKMINAAQKLEGGQ